LKLPYNKGQDKMDIARRFLLGNDLPIYMAEQIRSFIEQNVPDAPMNYGTQQSQVQKQQQQPQGQNQPQSNAMNKSQTDVFPLKQTFYFGQMNLEGMSKKLKELNDKIFDSQDARALNNTDWTHLVKLLQKLNDPLLYTNPNYSINGSEILSIKKLLNWDATNFPVVMDLVRIMMNHSGCEILFEKHDLGKSFIIGLLGRVNNKTIVNLFYKVLTNMTQQTAGINAIFASSDILSEFLDQSKLDFTNANHINSLCSFCMTFSVNSEMSSYRDHAFVRTVAHLAGL